MFTSSVYTYETQRKSSWLERNFISAKSHERHAPEITGNPTVFQQLLQADKNASDP